MVRPDPAAVDRWRRYFEAQNPPPRPTPEQVRLLRVYFGMIQPRLRGKSGLASPTASPVVEPPGPQKPQAGRETKQTQ